MSGAPPSRPPPVVRAIPAIRDTAVVLSSRSHHTFPQHYLITPHFGRACIRLLLQQSPTPLLLPRNSYRKGQGCHDVAQGMLL